VSPNQVRADVRRAAAARHTSRTERQVERIAKKTDLGLRTDASGAGSRKRKRAAGDEDMDVKTLFA
jgi:ribosome biogenesis protein BRX1